jgi:hypothetical protein
MATVVSAYYLFPSKFPSQRYFEWIRNFLEHIPCHLVFFTSEDLIPTFEAMRAELPGALEKTRFVALSLEEWKAFQRYGYPFWSEQRKLDPETGDHSPELYAIWYEKKEFVLRAAEMNPFGHTKFVWCDAGAFRYPIWFPHLQGFAQPDWIPEDKMLLLQIDPFTEGEKQAAPGTRDFSAVNRIGGGIQAGTAATWKRWSELYDAQLQAYRNQGKFVGKDQNLLAEMVLDHPEIVQMVASTHFIGDCWFTLLFVLSHIHRKPLVSVLIPIYNGVEFLRESLASIESQTFEDYEVLIGINGWPANSDVFQMAKAIVAASEDVRVLDLPDAKGKSAALNAMVKEARGSWIALLDVDDLWHPKKLEIQMQHKDSADVVGTAGAYFGERGGQPFIPLGDISDEDFWRVNPLLNSSVVLRKELAAWNPENRILEDYELWLRLRYTPRSTPLRFWNCPEVLLKHRVHKESYFNNNNRDFVGELRSQLKRELLGT